MEPTVVTDVSTDNLLFQEELFGPVLAVTKFSTEEEAMAMANDSDFGLLNGVWPTDLSRAHRFARILNLAWFQSTNIQLHSRKLLSLDGSNLE